MTTVQRVSASLQTSKKKTKAMNAIPDAKRIQLNWEPVATDSHILNRDIWRSPIRGGWLVFMSGADILTFVPDKHHKWDGGSSRNR